MPEPPSDPDPEQYLWNCPNCGRRLERLANHDFTPVVQLPLSCRPMTYLNFRVNDDLLVRIDVKGTVFVSNDRCTKCPVTLDTVASL